MIIKLLPNRVSRTYLGGHRIDKLRGEERPDGFCPEEWIASVTSAKNAGSTEPDEGLSRLADGSPLAGLLSANPGLLGKYDRFPILLKLLDAAERLAIQAHPTVSFAKANFGSDFGKAECWYILSADPGAHIYLGFREGITREDWKDCFERQDIGRMLSLMHRAELREGDIWYVDGGVPHAIGGGCLMAELQEPTDLMVVPERITPSGRIIPEARLHGGLGFERMFDCFSYEGRSYDELSRLYHRRPEPKLNTPFPVIDNTLTDKFSMWELRVSGHAGFDSDKPAAAVVVEGGGQLSDSDGSVEVKAGDGLFLSAGRGVLRAEGELRLLIAEP